MPSNPKLHRISKTAMSEVEEAMKEYYAVVDGTDLSDWAKAQYCDMVNQFVRWLKFDFEPGSRVAPYRKRDTKKEKQANPITHS